MIRDNFLGYFLFPLIFTSYFNNSAGSTFNALASLTTVSIVGFSFPSVSFLIRLITHGVTPLAFESSDTFQIF